MGLYMYMFAFFLWPIVLFRFGLENLGYRFFRALAALVVSLCGFAGYVIIPYRLLIFSHYYPMPEWLYIATPVAYIIGSFLYWKIDDTPLFSMF